MERMKEIHEWRSIRKYENKPVEKEKIEIILEAGRRAPSWQNLQPWFFMVITEDEKKKKLAEIAATPRVLERAPLVIAVLGDLNGMGIDEAKLRIREQIGDKLSDEALSDYLSTKISSPSKNSKEILLARVLEQVSYASAFMILEAVRQELGCCIIGGFDNALNINSKKYQEIKNYFHIPGNVEILTVLTMGYPAEMIPQRSRKEISSIIRWNDFTY